MSRLNTLTSTYINYYTPGKLDPDGIKLVTLNGKDCKVFYKTDYNTYIPNAINYIIGLLGHWGRKNHRPEEHVFISNKLLAKHIGISYSHASAVIDQIEEIFNLDVSHERGRGVARTVKISKTLVDFFKVFDEEELSNFMYKHSIPTKHRFAVQQVFRYIGWGISPAQLTPDERAKRKDYMSDEDRKNYWHYAYTSNQDPQSRIKQIEDHLEKLSESQQQQLSNLKAALRPGERLSIYWHRVLIKLQQIVSWLVSQDKKQSTETTTTSANTENTEKVESVAHASATMKSQKKPEEPTPVTRKPRETGNALQFIGQVIVSWNERAERNNLPLVKRLTKKRYHSLLAIMEEYTDKEIFKAISNIDYIHQGENHKHKFTFERFIRSETILYALEYNSNSNMAVEVNEVERSIDNINIKRRRSTVPQLESLKQLNSWLSTYNA